MAKTLLKYPLHVRADKALSDQADQASEILGTDKAKTIRESLKLAFRKIISGQASMVNGELIEAGGKR